MNPNKTKKLGIIIQYYDFRNDMRELISLLAKEYELTLFVTKNDDIKGKLPQNCQKVYIKSYKSNVRNKIWNTLYRFFCNRPKSRKNNLNWVKRRFGSSTKKIGNYVELISAYLAYYFPDWIDFDTYLKYLDYERTDIEGIDTFFSFTDVNDPYFIAQLIQENKKIVTYVYSWDHAAKYHKFSKKQIQYLTWNEEIKQDIIYQHQILPQNIDIIGSTQLSLLKKFLDKKTLTPNEHATQPYIYFAASAGYRVVAEQEIAYVEYLASILERIAPNIKLVFRPYPLLKDWDLYEPITTKENVALDNFRIGDKEFIFTADDLDAKFQKMSDALAIFHCGSTFGMEACYFDTPVFFIRFEDFPFKQTYKKIDAIENFIYQYHIEKYLDLRQEENVLDDYQKLDEILRKVIENPSLFLEYNHIIRNYSPLESLENICSNLTTNLEKPHSKLDAH